MWYILYTPGFGSFIWLAWAIKADTFDEVVGWKRYVKGETGTSRGMATIYPANGGVSKGKLCSSSRMISNYPSGGAYALEMR